MAGSLVMMFQNSFHSQASGEKRAASAAVVAQINGRGEHVCAVWDNLM